MKKDPKKELKKAKAHLHSAKAELESLQEQVHKLESLADASEKNDGGITKREVVQAAAWAAPVILAVNLPNGVFAKSALSPVSTPAPTSAGPTTAPAPTAAPAPTTSPTKSPVEAPEPSN